MSSAVAVGQPDETAWPLPDITKYLPLSETTLRAMVHAGHLPATRVGRRIFIFPSDVSKSPVLGPLWR
jgi:excisionase family DNA binding protein